MVSIVIYKCPDRTSPDIATMYYHVITKHENKVIHEFEYRRNLAWLLVELQYKIMALIENYL